VLPAAETQAGPLAAAWRIGSDGVGPELFDASVMSGINRVAPLHAELLVDRRTQLQRRAVVVLL